MSMTLKVGTNNQHLTSSGDRLAAVDCDASMPHRPAAYDAARLSQAVEPSFSDQPLINYAQECTGSTGHCCSCCGRSPSAVMSRQYLSK